eukprot:15376741-Alexandrium_andersonii.AAC.1
MEHIWDAIGHCQLPDHIASTHRDSQVKLWVKKTPAAVAKEVISYHGVDSCPRKQRDVWGMMSDLASSWLLTSVVLAVNRVRHKQFESAIRATILATSLVALSLIEIGLH